MLTGESCFLPAERADAGRLQEQVRAVQNALGALQALGDAGLEALLVLNSDGQIVFANGAAARMVGDPPPVPVVGARPGESQVSVLATDLLRLAHGLVPHDHPPAGAQDSCAVSEAAEEAFVL